MYMYVCMYTHHIIFIYSSVGRCLGCFRVLAVVNNAAVDIGVHASFQIRVLSGYVHRHGIAGSHDNSIFSFSPTNSYLQPGFETIVFTLEFLRVIPQQVKFNEEIKNWGGGAYNAVILNLCLLSVIWELVRNACPSLPKPAGSRTLGVEPSGLSFNSYSRQVWCMHKCEAHCSLSHLLALLTQVAML